MANALKITEAKILEEVVASAAADLSSDAARSFLKMRFDGRTKRLIERLLQRNNRGTIEADERVLLERYLRVGQLLDVLHATAHVSLQASSDG